jgi:hypothetical protein
MNLSSSPKSVSAVFSSREHILLRACPQGRGIVIVDAQGQVPQPEGPQDPAHAEGQVVPAHMLRG